MYVAVMASDSGKVCFRRHQIFLVLVIMFCALLVMCEADPAKQKHHRKDKDNGFAKGKSKCFLKLLPIYIAKVFPHCKKASLN